MERALEWFAHTSPGPLMMSPYDTVIPCCHFCNETSAIWNLEFPEEDGMGSEHALCSPWGRGRRDEEMSPIRKENLELGAHGNIVCVTLLGLRNMQQNNFVNCLPSFHLPPPMSVIRWFSHNYLQWILLRGFMWKESYGWVGFQSEHYRQEHSCLKQREWLSLKKKKRNNQKAISVPWHSSHKNGALPGVSPGYKSVSKLLISQSHAALPLSAGDATRGRASRST